MRGRHRKTKCLKKAHFVFMLDEKARVGNEDKYTLNKAIKYFMYLGSLKLGFPLEDDIRMSPI